MDEWWRSAVIYQVYPRSFQDTNGDGVGDLPGITRRLGHIASLGVDAVWISPFFKSPMKDYGYDVEDYRAVDPLFGTLEDFDRLLARAHQLGLRVLIDMVFSHTSDRHPWFRESRQSRDNPKADWYVWADARPDGTPPNNWLAGFGGVAWTWEPRRGQYYLHNFLPSQPDLNLWNPEVVAAVLDEGAFWLERGVDGFRLDAADFYLHDPELRDNPARPEGAPLPGGARPNMPVSRQIRIRNKAHPDIPERALRPLRALAERYGGAMLLAELHGDGALERVHSYTSGNDRLHAAYTFDLLQCAPAATAMRAVIESVEIERHGGGWPCWALANHDVARPPTRFGGPNPPDELRALLPALLTSLRGTICLYQGEELGLDHAELAYEDLRDPYGLRFYPVFAGRDGARTPMPWRRDAPHAGFSAARPWLPVPETHRERAVDVQDADPESVLARVRHFLRWRKRQPALLHGEQSFVDGVPESVLALIRHHEVQRLLCAFNVGPKPARWPLPESFRLLEGHGFTATVEGGSVVLPGYGALFGEVAAAGNGAPPPQGRSRHGRRDDARRGQALRPGRGDPRCRSRHSEPRVRGLRRAVGLRQVDALAPCRRT